MKLFRLVLKSLIGGLFILFLLVVASSLFGNNTTNNDINQAVETEKEKNKQESKEEEKEESTPAEYRNALESAKTYSTIMNMSEAGIYEQLTSKHGNGFTEESAKYAIEKLEVDYNENALESAKTYQKDIGLSRNEIYNQLVSNYGGRFTEEQAQYAIDNLPE